jgi:hypothetical protein
VEWKKDGRIRLYLPNHHGPVYSSALIVTCGRLQARFKAEVHVHAGWRQLQARRPGGQVGQRTGEHGMFVKITDIIVLDQQQRRRSRLGLVLAVFRVPDGLVPERDADARSHSESTPNLVIFVLQQRLGACWATTGIGHHVSGNTRNPLRLLVRQQLNIDIHIPTTTRPMHM